MLLTNDNLVALFICLTQAEAVPKKILEVMNVQGLTRENVASHLQVCFRLIISGYSLN